MKRIFVVLLVIVSLSSCSFIPENSTSLRLSLPPSARAYIESPLAIGAVMLFQDDSELQYYLDNPSKESFQYESGTTFAVIPPGPFPEYRSVFFPSGKYWPIERDTSSRPITVSLNSIPVGAYKGIIVHLYSSSYIDEGNDPQPPASYGAIPVFVTHASQIIQQFSIEKPFEIRPGETTVVEISNLQSIYLSFGGY